MKTLPIQFNFNKVGKYSKQANTSPKRIQQCQETPKTQTLREKYLDKLYEIFPKNQLIKFYSKLNKDFKIDYPAKLSFNATQTINAGTNYSFNNNSININLCEIIDKTHKVVNRKTGKTAISSFNQMPIFLSKQEATDYVRNNLSQDYTIKPITIKDQRKFILHKIAHEVIKAQQFMIMRQTQKIGDKGIIKAQNHSQIIKRAEQLDNYATYLHSNSFWKNHQTKQTISFDCSVGYQALIWLDSISHNSPYNAAQKDANQRAYNYIISNFGEY